MGTSIDQVARLLLEIPYIEARPGISVQEVASVFGVTPAQVRKDINVAIFCGLPGGYPSDLIDVDIDTMTDEGELYLTNPTSLDRPVRMTAAESASLKLALLALKPLVNEEMADDIDRVLAKISGAGVNVDLGLALGDEALRHKITEAISSTQRLRLTYEGQVRAQTTYPVVDPVAVYVSEGVAYLSAYCLTRSGWRTYRLDRIVEAEPTGESSQSHGHAPDPDSWAKSLAKSDTVKLSVTQGAAWIAEYYPITALTTSEDGLVEIELPVVEPAWLIRLLLSLGPQVRMVSPASYAEAARDLAAATLAAYEDLP